MFSIANNGQAMASTDYWGTEHAQRGLLYLSGNAGALRLLVPAAAESMLVEMRTGKRVTVEPSITQPGHIDLVFEDGSDSPFFVAIDRRQIDHKLARGKRIPFIVYSQAGEQLRLLAEVRP